MEKFIHFLFSIDQQIFYFVNVSMANNVLDMLMVWVTNKRSWYVPGGILWVLLVWKGGAKGRWIGLLIIIAIVLADQISATLLKPAFARLRPCKSLEGFRLLVHCGSKYGFPSSHASNIAAIGTLFIYTYRNWKYFWIFIIFIVGSSRIYVGVHYPLDVFCGWILGGIIGLGLVWFYVKLKPKINQLS